MNPREVAPHGEKHTCNPGHETALVHTSTLGNILTLTESRFFNQKGLKNVLKFTSKVPGTL